MMVEGTAATPDFAAACPVPGMTASPKHTSTTDTLTHSDDSGQRARGNENNINRKNSFHHSKQQQQTKLSKRRNTASFSFKHPTSGKRRRRANSESDSVLPTNFLLGGNIFDPLNLNSLLDEEVNKALNAETPKSSPLPAKSRDPVEILIPRDITDPLNLNSGIADSSFLVSPFKSGGRKRHRNRHHGGGGGGGGGVGGGTGSGISTAQINLSESGKSEVKTGTSAPLPGMLASSSALDVSKESNSFSSVTDNSHEHTADNSSSFKEEMPSVSMEDSTSSVSGVPNQHTSRRKRRRNSGKVEPPVTHSTPIGKSRSGDRSCGGQRNSQSFHTPRSGPTMRPGGRQHQQTHSQAKEQQKKKFQYGNYNKYYGYRNPGCSEDPRVRVLRSEWFEGKDVLDLGCNSGHLTLYIAKMLRPARILGLDIDSGLVHAARKNIRHYLSELQTQEARRAMQSTKQEERNGSESHTGTDKKQNAAESCDENGKPVKGEGGPAEAINDNDSYHTRETETQRQDSRIKEMDQEDCDSPPADHSGSCSFPVSLRISRGPIAAPPLTEASTTRPGEFPSNVSFIKVRRHSYLYKHLVVVACMRDLQQIKITSTSIFHYLTDIFMKTRMNSIFHHTTHPKTFDRRKAACYWNTLRSDWSHKGTSSILCAHLFSLETDNDNCLVSKLGIALSQHSLVAPGSLSGHSCGINLPRKRIVVALNFSQILREDE